MKKTLLSLIFLFLLWIAGFAVFVISALSMRPNQPDTPTDAIIVLTGGENRIEEGLKLFAEGKTLHLYITGVHPDTSEADIKSRWTEDTALPPCCMTLGHDATTTYENAVEAREWLKDEDYSSIRLVTSNYHMLRALIEFNHALPDIKIIPHPSGKSGFDLSQRYYWYLLASEYHKSVFRWFGLMFQERKPVNPETDHKNHLPNKTTSL